MSEPISEQRIMREITLIVYGLPAPQGSKRHVGHGIMVESSKNVKPWREAVRWACIEAGLPHVPGPVSAEMVFTMRKPKSASRRRKTYPDRTPDLSKLVRATEDALTQIGAWEDDARVVQCSSSKVFPMEGTYALSVTGAFIRIRALAEVVEGAK